MKEHILSKDCWCNPKVEDYTKKKIEELKWLIKPEGDSAHFIMGDVVKDMTDKLNQLIKEHNKRV